MDKVDQNALSRIGDELTDLYLESRLDFASFQRLFHEARAICGANSDHMEMFCQFAVSRDWREWMTQELQKTPSRRVA